MSSLFAELPIVVSYYTKNTPYEEEVQGLIESCHTFGIEYCIEGIEDRGNWEENCAIKPYFIKEKLLELKRPLLWVDADAVFLQKMQFEEFMFFDLSIFKEEKKDPRFCVRSGTVYINATEKGIQAAESWCNFSEKVQKLDQKTQSFQDQVSLYFTFLSTPSSSFANLPLAYCSIFDEKKEELPSDQVVIEHRQASRRFHTKKEKSSI